MQPVSLVAESAAMTREVVLIWETEVAHDWGSFEVV